ncbi:MAG: hypothetical protein ABIA76_02245 [Candidatus Diapherotrites archaeon]
MGFWRITRRNVKEALRKTPEAGRFLKFRVINKNLSERVFSKVWYAPRLLNKARVRQYKYDEYFEKGKKKNGYGLGSYPKRRGTLDDSRDRIEELLDQHKFSGVLFSRVKSFGSLMHKEDHIRMVLDPPHDPTKEVSFDLGDAGGFLSAVKYSERLTFNEKSRLTSMFKFAVEKLEKEEIVSWNELWAKAVGDSPLRKLSYPVFKGLIERFTETVAIRKLMFESLGIRAVSYTPQEAERNFSVLKKHFEEHGYVLKKVSRYGRYEEGLNGTGVFRAPKKAEYNSIHFTVARKKAVMKKKKNEPQEYEPDAFEFHLRAFEDEHEIMRRDRKRSWFFGAFKRKKMPGRGKPVIKSTEV